MVLARFDLGKTRRELVIALSVPVSLFVVSFISLCIITRSVKVGDDAKMRCKYCTDENSDLDDNEIENNNRTTGPVQEDNENLKPGTSKVNFQAKFCCSL